MSNPIDLDKLRESYMDGCNCYLCNYYRVLILSLLDELKEKTEALEFYSNKDNWTFGQTSTHSQIKTDESIVDFEVEGEHASWSYGGKRAREVLEKYKRNVDNEKDGVG